MMSIPAATGLVLLGVAAGELWGNTSMPDLAGRATLPAHVAGAGGAAPAASPPVSVPNASLQAPPPLWISVPRFGGRAPVTGEVAIQTSGPEKGLLDAPPNYHDLGWFRDGGSGLLVIDGHVGYRTDPGPLAFIGQLSDGDRILVGTEKGTGAFVVTAVARVVKGQLPPQYFTPAFDGDLMLITCDYTSPFSAGHFADNVYVVAVPQP